MKFLKENPGSKILAEINSIIDSRKPLALRSKKALICLGGGPSQIPVIKAAQKHGFAIITIDKDVNAPGLSISEIALIISTHDSHSCLTAILKIQKSFDIIGVLNRSSGQPVITTAILNEALGFPGVPVSSARTSVHKHLLREKLWGLGNLSPQYVTKPDFQGLILPFDYPVIVKPSLSMVGKSGITKVVHSSALGKAIALAQEVSVDNKVIIEDYIEGDDLSVIGFVQKGKLLVLSLMDEINGTSEGGLIEGRGFALPSRYSKTEIEQKVIKAATAISRELKLIQSPFMVSFRLDKNQTPKLIEIHLDLGGDLLIEHLFPHCLSVDFLDIAVSISAEEVIEDMELSVKPGALLYSHGSGLNRERPISLLEAGNRDELEDKLKEYIV